VAAEENTNEIPAVRDLPDMTEVNDHVVMRDALNTQTETAAQVIRKSGACGYRVCPADP
jgi:hypothetical protein